MIQKSLITRFGEAIDQHRLAQAETRGESGEQYRIASGRHWLPVAVNVMLVFLLIGVFWAQSVGAISFGAAQVGTSTGTIAYQGRLADASGNSLTQTVNMVFRLYAAADGGAPLWEEQWTTSNGVQVSDGLFNVMLGSLTPIPQAVVTANDPLFLGISVGTDDEMAPRVQLGSVPFAVQALTVPDGSIATDKLIDGAVTSRKQTIRAFHFSDPSYVIGYGTAGTTVSEFTVPSAPAGDATIVCNFVASHQTSGVSYPGSVHIVHNGTILSRAPTHIFSSQWTQYSIHAAVQNFAGGDFTFQITVGGEGAAADAEFRFGTSTNDQRFGRRCTVTVGL